MESNAKVDLGSKVALVTGGAQGIGEAICRKLYDAGAHVAISDVDGEGAKRVAESLDGNGRSIALQVDVSLGESVQKMVDMVLETFETIDLLINNAGIARDGFIVRMKEEDWNSVIDVNLKGIFFCTKAVLPVMIKQRSGKIINLSSVVALIGNPGQANYSASKSGVIGLTKSAAREVASRGITINAIAPGFIETPMTERLPDTAKEMFLRNIPLGRGGTPEDVAKVVLFLASDLADYITGQVIHVDGGMVMS
jgi:3-oxoacyl-[acyl-carrier protein] reductase